MTATLIGPYTWSAEVDEEGYTTYEIIFTVKCDRDDGPSAILQAEGLVQPGDSWNFESVGTGGAESDQWATCKQTCTVTPDVKGEPNTQFKVKKVFSTKPVNRCQDDKIENPLLIPPKISGSFVKYSEEATKDRFGRFIQNSAHEQIRGPQVEFDKNRITIKIEQNVADLQLSLLAKMTDTVNSVYMWGFPPRCIKLAPPSWERKFYGHCSIYYSRTLEFEINAAADPDTGIVVSKFDKDILDEGTKVLHGHWSKSSGHWVLDDIGALNIPKIDHDINQDSAGSLTSGTYSYKITAVNNHGETTAGVAFSTGLLDFETSSGRNILLWLPIEGAEYYNIYGRTPGSELLLGTPSPTIGVFENGFLGWIDDGSVDPTGNPSPPTKNTATTPPDPTNPEHFDQFKDRKNENARVILNGAGLPAGAVIGTGTGTGIAEQPGSIHVEKYDESNFFLLSGIPTSF